VKNSPGHPEETESFLGFAAQFFRILCREYVYHLTLFFWTDTRLILSIDPLFAQAMIRAAKEHGQHEKQTGQADPNWPDWYAEYMVREQSGEELPH